MAHRDGRRIKRNEFNKHLRGKGILWRRGEEIQKKNNQEGEKIFSRNLREMPSQIQRRPP